MRRLLVLLFVLSALALSERGLADVDVDVDSNSKIDAAFGGSNADTSGWTGYPYITGGVWSQKNETYQPLDADLTTLSSPTAWRFFYSNESAVLTQVAFGADGTFLESNGVSAAPAFRLLLTTDISDLTASAAEINILDGVTGVTAAELSHIGDVTSLIQAQLDLLAPLVSPTFTGTITIGSAGISEAELEILDGATLDTTELNYLDGATGVTGTGNTVRSADPVFTGSPTLGTPTATSITLDASATPGWVFRDSGNPGTDKEIAKFDANFLSGADGAEDGAWYLRAMLAGSEVIALEWNSDNEQITMGDSGTGEDLIWDFEEATDNEVGVSTNSGTTNINFGAIGLQSTGTMNFSGATAVEIENTAGDVTLANGGEVAVDTTQRQFAFHDGTEEIAIPTIQVIQLTFDPGAWYDSDAEVWMLDLFADRFPDGIVITKWYVDTNVADPDVEMNMNLMWCDAVAGAAFPGANPTLIDVMDTTTGNSSETVNTNMAANGVVATGKSLYLLFDADPEGEATQLSVKIYYYIPES
jgi:hypothetical protein